MPEITRGPKGTYILTHEQRFEMDREQTFDFFSRAENLEAITPSSLRFHLITPKPIDMHRGTIIEYRLRINGVPVYWRTLISEWEPPFRFVDVQQKGPYRLWRHEHRFEALEGGGTLMRDRVEYRLPLGPLGHLAHFLFVRRQLMAIWKYRERKIGELLQPDA